MKDDRIEESLVEYYRWLDQMEMNAVEHEEDDYQGSFL